MPVRKHEEFDLRKRYPLFIELGLIATLAILIVAFRVDWAPDNDFEIVMQEQEKIQIEEIKQTQQIETPPPPPKPPVPVEVPNDELLDEDELELDAFLDFDEPIAETPPPPPTEPEPEPEPEIFVIVEEMPELVGGLAAIQKKIKYPEIAKKAGVEGRVIVQFIVDENGKVTDPQVVRGIGAGCDEEAIRAVRSAEFKPGKQRGKPVKVKMSLPITFKLK